jgi:exodeoxyribonuclease VII large subunit
VRAPTPSAAAELVVARKDEFCSRIDRLHDRLTAVMRSRTQAFSRRVHILAGRPALAGFPGRVAMQGRHVSEIGHALAAALRSAIGVRDRRLRKVERQLAMFDAGKRLAEIRTRLVGTDAHLRRAAARRHDRAQSQLQSAAARLESLSPLAVLGRGYAVAWDAAKTHIIRDPATLTPGDTIRVTVERGEIGCEVKSTS